MTLPEQPTVYRCDDCNIRIPANDILRAPSPFNDVDEIFACPVCMSEDALRFACAVDGCTSVVSSGVPGSRGYRYAWLCSKHYDEDRE